jgi:hypothetical protein
MLANIWETVQKIWDFLNQPYRFAFPEDSFVSRFWKFATSPMPTLPWAAVCEFIQVVMMILAMVCMILYMMGARGKISRCLYWCVSLYIVITILS